MWYTPAEQWLLQKGTEPLTCRFLDDSAELLADYVKDDPSCHGHIKTIDTVHASALTYEGFVKRYMAPNRPVLVLVRSKPSPMQIVMMLCP